MARLRAESALYQWMINKPYTPTRWGRIVGLSGIFGL